MSEEWKIVEEGNANPPVCAVINSTDTMIIVDSRMRMLDPLPVAKRICSIPKLESELTTLRRKCEELQTLLEKERRKNEHS